jgi:hypothetical protein
MDAKKEIFLMTSFHVRSSMLWKLFNANFYEGQQIAKEQSIEWSSRNWFYYNSDYYFFDKELTKLIQTASYEFAKEQGLNGIDLESHWRSVHIGERNFNTLMNSFSQHTLFLYDTPQINTFFGKLNDSEPQTPRGFKLFYTEMFSKQEAKTGVFFKRLMIVNQHIVIRNGESLNDRFSAIDFWAENTFESKNLFDFLMNFDFVKSKHQSPMIRNPYYE